MRVSILDLVHDSSNKLSRIESRIESRRTENKRFTHDWFFNNFTTTSSYNTTRHGYICASDCMHETRPSQVINQMFLQHLYQASFPSVKFQTPAPNANKQCILKQQHVYFVMSISCNPMQGCKHTRPSVTWLISCSEIVFMILKYCPETRWKVMDCFSSSTRVSWQLLLFRWWKTPFEHFKVLTQSITWAVRTNANFLKSCPWESCQLLLLLLFAYFRNFSQESNQVCWVEFFTSIEYKDFSDVREVRRLLKMWTKVVTCRFSQQSGIKGRQWITRKWTKQRLFRFDESRRNLELRLNSRELTLD